MARDRGESRLEFRLLGSLEARYGEQALRLGGAKPRALLASLLLDLGRVVSVDRLVDAVWGEEAPATAAHAVKVNVSQLRKALEPAGASGIIVTRAPGYLLELDSEQVDVHRFQRLADEGRAALRDEDPALAGLLLREALSLWRGPALADFLYEPFAQTDIARLEELRLVVTEARLEADLALGRHAELVGELESLVTAEPLRERLRGLLMLALYRAGRQADALAVYREAREALVEELGIEPGPALRELEAAILRQDEGLLLPAAAPPPRPTFPMQFRRLVTILFADVVDSLALAEALDPEALFRVMRRYFEMVSTVVERHGGTVEKFAGDAVMAAFGVPVSHEDDALRAARAALETRTSLAALNNELAELGVRLEMRMGIDTGEVLTEEAGARQRFVTGDAVGVASRLQEAAAPGQIVVGALTRRLIGHAGRLEPIGELAVKGKRQPVEAFRLLDLAVEAPSFERRLDEPPVDRKRELAALRKALKRAVDGSAPHAVIVVGPAGIGKSRIARELVRRSKGVTVLIGRCLSYGEGVTYWPLKEIVREAAGGEERDAIAAVLSGEDADSIADRLTGAIGAADAPPPAAEIAWAFRRFCETLAARRPLLLVLDDLHWAEPTFLDLTEHLVERSSGPIVVVGLAREELIEERPGFLEDASNAERLLLDGLAPADTDELIERLLGGGTLLDEQRARVVEAAEGNPLFVEQLLALTAEGGLGPDRTLPATIQALLAARFDRLGPGERAVLERGAVIGKEFRAADVAGLLDPAAASTVGRHLQALVRRGFVRTAADDTFRFGHGLIQEAVYRAAPRELRAQLHERYADQLARDGDGELDELLGYHLEQAYRHRAELGQVDRRTKQLATSAGARLGAAGIRAWKRGDAPATVNLLGRATALLPRDEPTRQELLCELGIALRAAGDPRRSQAVLSEAIETSGAFGDRRLELRARLELANVRLFEKPEGGADELLEIATSAIPIFEAALDHRSLARAWLLVAFVHGGFHCEYDTSHQAAERALEEYARSGWPASSCPGEIAAALYYGPTPVSLGIRRCNDLLAKSLTDIGGEASVLVWMGGLEAMRLHFEEGRRLVDQAERRYQELGWVAVAAGNCGTVRGQIERLAGDFAAAEQALRRSCELLERFNDQAHLSTQTAELAAALYAQGRLDEAESWARVSQERAASDDVSAQFSWRQVRARILARRGDIPSALALAFEAVRLSERTDSLNQRANALVDLAHVLRLAGRASEATVYVEAALRLYESKGNVAECHKTRALLEQPALA